ncbi:universal stress protein [Halapricum desulfuricans]|uniref:Nucleotide-binding protein, UspA family n=1 Tax=Halapricum desulfuricans TaxID=2841257 RepID=A0A897NNE4_9EURY|nr:universal stress protein [Halapricum desulfuricans]QSG14282.1 Nucleotide-binding protein, UspA family [Halapricum desulfuricans]
MYQDILYPTDGSGGATAALEHVGDLADKYDATVHVLYVLDTSQPGLGLGEDPDKEHAPGMIGHPDGEGSGMVGERETHEELHARQQEYGETVVETVADRLEGVDVETAVRTGTPHETILDYAEENADMIVMGTHGRTGLDRYLLGSVTENVVRMADVPVVTVRAEQSS